MCQHLFRPFVSESLAQSPAPPPISLHFHELDEASLVICQTKCGVGQAGMG